MKVRKASILLNEDVFSFDLFYSFQQKLKAMAGYVGSGSEEKIEHLAGETKISLKFCYQIF